MSDRRHPSTPVAHEDLPRRGFMIQAVTGLLSAVLALIPLGIGLAFFLDPVLRRKNDSASGTFIKVTNIDAIPEDGTPRAFPVIADQRDAWNLYRDVGIGSVYLRKLGDQVIAFNQECTHLGCLIDYKPGLQEFVCPCHDSSFSLDGVPTNQIPPRRLDPLDVDIRDGEVWVKFIKFRAAAEERIPV